MHMVKRLALAGAALLALGGVALACDCNDYGNRGGYSCYGGGYDCHFTDGYGRDHYYGPRYGGGVYGAYEPNEHYILDRGNYDGYWRDGVRYDRDGYVRDEHWRDWHDGHFDGHDGWHDGDGQWHAAYQRDGRWHEGDGRDFRGGVGRHDGDWHDDHDGDRHDGDRHDGDHHDGNWHDGDHHDDGGSHDGRDGGWHH